MVKRFMVMAAIIVTIAAMCTVVTSDVPQLINFQGKLYDRIGNPLNGAYEVTFRIYDDEEGDTALWTETDSVSCIEGLYHIILGLTTLLDLGFDGQYWLGVQVIGDEELSPRYRLVSVPTAFRAQVANQVSWTNLTDVPPGFVDGIDNIGGGGAGGGWVDDGAVVRLENASAKVGIGTDSPEAKLHVVDGELRISNPGDGNVLLNLASERSWAFRQFGTGSHAALELASVGGGNKNFGINTTGYIGIGTDSPAAKLHVYGEDPEIRVSDSSSGTDGRGAAYLRLERGGIGKDRALVTYHDGSISKWHVGLLYNYGKPTPYFHISQKDFIGDGSTSHTPELTITTDSDVGIGTASPTGKLHVMGSVVVGSSDARAGGMYSTAIGSSAVAFGDYSTAIGYAASAYGDFATAIGYNASAPKDGSIAIADHSTTSTLFTQWSDTFLARFIRGFYFYTSTDLSTGAILGNGDSSWGSVSDSTKKENFKPADGEAFLNKISRFKLGSWNFIGQDPQRFRHYGPMAQDFHAAFGNDGIGTIGNDTTIASADFDGVAFIALQALEKRTHELLISNTELQIQNDGLQATVEQLTMDNKKLAQEVDQLKMQNLETRNALVKNETEITELKKVVNNIIHKRFMITGGPLD